MHVNKSSEKCWRRMLQCIEVKPLLYLNAVALHADQEARGQLRARCASIEQRWRRMCKPTLTEHVVCQDGALNVFLMHAY